MLFLSLYNTCIDAMQSTHIVGCRAIVFSTFFFLLYKCVGCVGRFSENVVVVLVVVRCFLFFVDVYRIVSIYFGAHYDDVEYTNWIVRNINILLNVYGIPLTHALVLMPCIQYMYVVLVLKLYRTVCMMRMRIYARTYDVSRPRGKST